MSANNKFPMPFIVPVEEAVQHIIRGLERGKYEIAFPWQLAAFMKLLRLMPNGLFFWYARTFMRRGAERVTVVPFRHGGVAWNLDGFGSGEGAGAMGLDRRRFLGVAGLGAAAVAALPVVARAGASPLSSLGIDAGHLGVRAGSPDDQSARCSGRSAGGGAAGRWRWGGRHRAGDLKLPAGAQITGVRGATRLVLTRGPSLVSAAGADWVSLGNVTLDGGGRPLPAGRGLVQISHGRGLRITDCEIVAAGGHGVMLESVEGEVSGTSVSGVDAAGIFSLDARGLRITSNTVRSAGSKRHPGVAVEGRRRWRARGR
jgi:hypothetical protein